MNATLTADAATEVRPRPVCCVIEHLHRDRGVAEEACRGRFTELGTTLELGLEPDWLGARFPADEEWRIAFGKFYFGLDLAAAFGQTGDPRYLRTWEGLVSSWVEQMPLGAESTDTVARRMLNWIYAWGAFVQASGFGGLSRGLDRLLLASLSAQAGWLRHHLTARRNHRTLELYALFVFALSLPLVDPDGALLGFALEQLDENLAEDFRVDGVHVESSTHYHLIVLRSFVGVRVNARRYGIPLPDGFDERLGRALDFAVHCHRPDGGIPALSDADGGSYAELLRLAGEELGRADSLYVATRGARGTAPRERNVSFPAGGYHVQRSGWGKRDRFLIFDCGPLGDGGHGHYDLLSVELAAGGRPLVLDPGRYTYHEGEPNLRRWFKGTAAHNTICVDGLDQTEYWRGKPKGPLGQGRFLGRARAAGLDVVWGEAVSPRYDARHARRVLFVADEYWVVEDRLTAPSPHRYDQRWHLAPESLGRVEVDRAGGVVRAAGLALLFSPGVELTVEPGWYAPRYGIKVDAPVISATRAGAGDARFITVAVPWSTDGRAPWLRVLEGHERGHATIEVRGVGPRGDARDRVAWAADGSWHHHRRDTYGGGEKP
jgi:Heparinase II/III-like protein/Heparinase II/III N-terminus